MEVVLRLASCGDWGVVWSGVTGHVELEAYLSV